MARTWMGTVLMLVLTGALCLRGIEAAFVDGLLNPHRYWFNF